jgi:hypothetical protein
LTAEQSHEPVDERADGNLRSPMLEDGQPWLTWWLPLPGIALTALWAAYQTVAGDGDPGGTLLRTLAWPGVAIFVVTTITTYFGWRLDID